MRRIGQKLTLLRESAVESVEQRIEALAHSAEFVGGIINRQPRTAGWRDARRCIGHAADRAQGATGEPPSGHRRAEHKQRDAHAEPPVDPRLQRNDVGFAGVDLDVPPGREIRVEREAHRAHRP